MKSPRFWTRRSSPRRHRLSSSTPVAIPTMCPTASRSARCPSHRGLTSRDIPLTDEPLPYSVKVTSSIASTSAPHDADPRSSHDTSLSASLLATSPASAPVRPSTLPRTACPAPAGPLTRRNTPPHADQRQELQVGEYVISDGEIRQFVSIGIRPMAAASPMNTRPRST